MQVEEIGNKFASMALGIGKKSKRKARQILEFLIFFLC